MDKEISKEEAYERVLAGIKRCTEEDSHYSAVVIIVNNDKETVRVHGLNMDEFEVPYLLMEVAENVAEGISGMYSDRTLN